MTLPKTPHLPEGIQFALIPFYSPLLRKSHLFSFPPRTKMFLFSGFPIPDGNIHHCWYIGSPIRVSLDLRLHASPQSISLLVTPFFGSLGKASIIRFMHKMVYSQHSFPFVKTVFLTLRFIRF